MKITIDLAEAFDRDEDTGDIDYKGVREAIIEKAARLLIDGKTYGFSGENSIERQVKEVVGAAITASVKTQIDKLFVDFLDEQFTPISEYGAKSTPTTVRNRIAEMVQKACTITSNDRYGNANTFTKVVHDAAEAKMSEFKKEFSKQVDNLFVAQAVAHATAELKRKLGVTS